jgi:hypothetical protein
VNWVGLPAGTSKAFSLGNGKAGTLLRKTLIRVGLIGRSKRRVRDSPGWAIRADAGSMGWNRSAHIFSEPSIQQKFWISPFTSPEFEDRNASGGRGADTVVVGAVVLVVCAAAAGRSRRVTSAAVTAILMARPLSATAPA